MASVTACNVSDVLPGKMIKVTIDGKDILVANIDGTFYAAGDTCTHSGSSLSEGRLDGDRVVCGWHAAEFDCKTGKLAKFPAKINDLPSYKVSIESGKVILEL